MLIENTEDFGYFVRQTRKKYNITQDYVSRESGITRSMISNIERGKTKDTRLSTAIKIANALNRGLLTKDLNELE